VTQGPSDLEIETMLASPGKPEFVVAKVQAVLTSRVVASLKHHGDVLSVVSQNIYGQTNAMGEQTNKIVAALNDHAQAMKDATAASDRYAGRLVWATWALVAATAALIIVSWYRG
jgi:hypothetical protein